MSEHSFRRSNNYQKFYIRYSLFQHSKKKKEANTMFKDSRSECSYQQINKTVHISVFFAQTTVLIKALHPNSQKWDNLISTHSKGRVSDFQEFQIHASRKHHITQFSHFEKPT